MKTLRTLVPLTFHGLLWRICCKVCLRKINSMDRRLRLFPVTFTLLHCVCSKCYVFYSFCVLNDHETLGTFAVQSWILLLLCFLIDLMINQNKIQSYLDEIFFTRNFRLEMCLKWVSVICVPCAASEQARGVNVCKMWKLLFFFCYFCYHGSLSLILNSLTWNLCTHKNMLIFSFILLPSYCPCLCNC